MREAGPFRQHLGKLRPKGPRTVTVGEHAQQFPQSPSVLTAWAQRGLDRLSKTGRIPGYKASHRVAKQAGKTHEQEIVRARALRGEETHALSRLKGQSGVAHFWWAQLPKRLRNVEGLRLVRAKLDQERIALARGRKPREAESAARAVAKLDKLIAKPPRVNEHVLEHLDTLMREREDDLIAAGKLHPERAAERKGLVARWIGVEPTGEEIYVGHRMDRVRGTRPGVGLGRSRLPQGVATQNTLHLLRTGKARMTLEHAIEDHQASQVYKFHNIAKDTLAAMGRPVEELIAEYGHIPKDYYVVNPHGHRIPRDIHIDPRARAASEGFDEHDLERYVKSYLIPASDEQAVSEAFRHSSDLRAIPASDVKRYFGQYIDPKLLAGTPIRNLGRSFEKGTNLVNDIIATSLLYSNPGYIPANLAQNLIMAGLHQGAFAPFNLVRAGQALFHGPRRLRNLLRAEVGQGPTLARTTTGEELRGTHWMRNLAHGVGAVADNGPRVAAFLHEAARLGVISKTSLRLSREDYRRLEDFLTNPEHRAALNDARDRAVQSMVDFQRLGPNERAIVKRLIFVYSWIRGGTRYPFRFALDHPIRSGAMAYVLAGEPGAPEGVQERTHELLPDVAQGLPPWLEGALEAGDGRVLPTHAISPVSQPYDIYKTVRGVEGAQTPAEMTNPALRALVEVASEQNRYGEHVGRLEALTDVGKGLEPPLTKLIRDEIHPEPSNYYPEDASRVGRLKRAVRVAPIEVDTTGASAKAQELVHESRDADLGDPPERVLQEVHFENALNHEVHKRHKDYNHLAGLVAGFYDRLYPGTSIVQDAHKLRNEEEAERFYHSVRRGLFAELHDWRRHIDAVHDQRLAASG